MKAEKSTVWCAICVANIFLNGNGGTVPDNSDHYRGIMQGCFWSNVNEIDLNDKGFQQASNGFIFWIC